VDFLLEYDRDQERLTRLRQNWDPFDPWDKFLRDGHKARFDVPRRRPWTREQEAQRLGSDLSQIRRATKTSNDVVYLVQAQSGGPVKIGHSTFASVKKRLKSLQCSHHEELVIRALFDGTTWLESALHELFWANRIRGEWFTVSPLMRELCPELV
jgi:hypothetical protein